MMRRTILILTLGLALSTPVHADIAAAYYALNHGDFKAAVEEFSRLADTGDARAQSYLGYMYYVGQGVKQDYGQAVRWFRKAAQQGDRDAEYNLAVSYAFGKGVKKDLKTAVHWYRKAAKQGHAAAQYSLGLSYARGDGVKQDREKALRWFRKAADQGYADAQKALQGLSENPGKTTSSDADDDHSEAQGATETAHSAQPSAAGGLADMDGIESTLPGAETPAKVLLAEKTAGDGKNDPPAAGAVYTAMEAGGGGTEKKGLLEHPFNKSNDTSAQETGLKTAPAQQSDKADLTLYQKGMTALSNKRYQDAATAFHEAAQQGDPRSQFQLGSLFFQGLGVTQDYNEALHWYQMAAGNNNTDAQYSLGNMYLMGQGVKQSDQKAAYWYKKAAAQGDDLARQNLENLKRIISQAGEKPPEAEGARSKGDAKAAQKTSGQKRGFFSRLFGRDKSHADERKARRSSASADQASPDNGLFGLTGDSDS